MGVRRQRIMPLHRGMIRCRREGARKPDAGETRPNTPRLRGIKRNRNREKTGWCRGQSDPQFALVPRPRRSNSTVQTPDIAKQFPHIADYTIWACCICSVFCSADCTIDMGECGLDRVFGRDGHFTISAAHRMTFVYSCT